MSAPNRRMYIYWRTLARALAEGDAADAFEPATRELAAALDLPGLILEERASLDQVLARHPELAAELDALIPSGETPTDDASVRRALLYSKVLVSVFGSMGPGAITAAQYSEWIKDCGHFERVMGFGPGELRSGRGVSAGTSAGMPSMGRDTKATGVAPEITEQDVAQAVAEIERGRGLMSAPEIQASLSGMEKGLIKRMALREVLADPELAAKLTPSMALVEQLLRDKDNLSGLALTNARRIIRRYVDELGDVLRRQVASSPKGSPDRSVPPKRVFRNLDIWRTVWKNLTNWDPQSRRLYVDRMYYRHRATKQNQTRLIVVVDQSGSMVDAMVNCTILASIFAGLPKVDARLVAFDTEVLDLTPWIHDPFEVLLRTNLGGGNDGPKAMQLACTKIADPRNTVMVWISDFYEFDNDRPLMKMIEAVHQSGVTFIPVGSVSSSGYFNVNPWFRQELKKLGTPLLSGSLKTLIKELRTALP